MVSFATGFPEVAVISSLRAQSADDLGRRGKKPPDPGAPLPSSEPSAAVLRLDQLHRVHWMRSRLDAQLLTAPARSHQLSSLFKRLTPS